MLTSTETGTMPKSSLRSSRLRTLRTAITYGRQRFTTSMIVGTSSSLETLTRTCLHPRWTCYVTSTVPPSTTRCSFSRARDLISGTANMPSKPSLTRLIKVWPLMGPISTTRQVCTTSTAAGTANTCLGPVFFASTRVSPLILPRRALTSCSVKPVDRL